MAADDVAPPEMRPFRPAPDIVDAVLRGDPVSDPTVEALVHDLRAAYLPEDDRPRSAALVAFTGPASTAGDPALAPSRQGPVRPVAGSHARRFRVALAAFVATLTGKVVLGGAIAAATVGGLHATEVLDVPLLPDVDRRPPVTDPTPAGPELPALDAGEGPGVAPDPAGDAGTARTSVPATSGADDDTGPDRPGAAPEVVSEAGDDPSPGSAPTTAGPPQPTTTAPNPGRSPGTGEPAPTAPPGAGDPSDAPPPTTATQSQSSRNIP